MEDQRGLAKIRGIFIVIGVLDKRIAQPLLGPGAVMEERRRALLLPPLEIFGAESRPPARGELESGRQQNHALDLARMARGVQRRQVSSQARPHQDHGLSRHRSFDDSELAGDGQPPKIAFVQLRNLEEYIPLVKLPFEELGFARLGAGGESVQVHDPHQGASPNLIPLEVWNLWKLA